MNAIVHVSLDYRRKQLVAVIKAEHFLQQPWLKDGTAIHLEGGVRFHVTADDDMLRGTIAIPGQPTMKFYGSPADVISGIEVIASSLFAQVATL